MWSLTLRCTLFSLVVYSLLLSNVVKSHTADDDHNHAAEDGDLMKKREDAPTDVLEKRQDGGFDFLGYFLNGNKQRAQPAKIINLGSLLSQQQPAGSIVGQQHEQQQLQHLQQQQQLQHLQQQQLLQQQQQQLQQQGSAVPSVDTVDRSNFDNGTTDANDATLRQQQHLVSQRAGQYIGNGYGGNVAGGYVVNGAGGGGGYGGNVGGGGGGYGGNVAGGYAQNGVDAYAANNGYGGDGYGVRTGGGHGGYIGLGGYGGGGGIGGYGAGSGIGGYGAGGGIGGYGGGGGLGLQLPKPVVGIGIGGDQKSLGVGNIFPLTGRLISALPKIRNALNTGGKVIMGVELGNNFYFGPIDGTHLKG